MRLINTHTLSFSEFYGDNIPAYAILSHTWGAEEVTYSEWLSRDENCLTKEGYKKINSACEQAVKDGWDWLWADTNCIDKSSSAELTEAINSMYQWYEYSQVCYAYLVDVPSHESQHGSVEHLTSSRWFTRGWTLQELLAPKRLTFYSKEWSILGDKSDPEISKMISEVTGIDGKYLVKDKRVRPPSVAQRMSWLARRQTTRTEDIAYCMLGIFGINMPLLYGEGPRAFTRLQEEIIKISHDHTLFCWTRTTSTPLHWNSILAPSPREFEDSGDYISKEIDESLNPYATTNLGLSIQLPVIHTFTYPFILLNAGLRSHGSGNRACLPMAYTFGQSSVRTSPLVRHWFPEGPINLEPFNATLMRRHHFLIARSQGTTPWSHVPSEFYLNVLIVMQPTDSTLFRGSQPVAFQNPENSGLEVAYIHCPFIDTYPRSMFEYSQGILHLPIIGEGPNRLNACVMFVSLLGDIENGYFLFFGCRGYADQKPVWSCKIVSRASHRQQKQDNQEMQHLFKDFVNSDFSEETGRRSRVSDGSLVLEIGKSVPFGQNQSLRNSPRTKAKVN